MKIIFMIVSLVKIIVNSGFHQFCLILRTFRFVRCWRGIYRHFYGAKVVARGWRRWPYAVRSRAMSLIEQMAPEPHAGLAEGSLLGVDAGIPEVLYDRFKATGMSHVLVISGPECGP